MPELPEVEITRRGIEPFVLGKTITGVVVRNPNLRQRIPRKLARILVGQRVQRLERRGKYLLFQCDSGSLIVHLGMSGSLRTIDPGTLPRDHDHVDLVFGATALRLRDPRRIRDALDRLIPDTSGIGAAKADVIIEAIFENVEAKRALFAKLEPLAKPGAR